jgi:hypothetical protein
MYVVHKVNAKKTQWDSEPTACKTRTKQTTIHEPYSEETQEIIHTVMHERFTWLIIMGSGLGDWIYWHFYYNYNQLEQLTINDCFRLATFLTGLRVSSHPLYRMTNESLNHWTPLWMNYDSPTNELCLSVFTYSPFITSGESNRDHHI